MSRSNLACCATSQTTFNVMWLLCPSRTRRFFLDGDISPSQASDVMNCEIHALNKEAVIYALSK